ncbi:16S rRNA (guanine(527)-N(7))-methyltransferase RsmG [Petrocella sp. FN5]|uniref:16S rRNA (guanine(527)-N(7))-methyltransferase RsmG n=1 Tax=Petrocella sp. FN5 TaxID=3032002 RepID=UPI0023DB5073|nr:16S rRNA (guanine(527)-N(7))-methyltransferase RsmG [Petrocella sp. FN5]MDF1617420.1 16S rRNA (guanine(527)-N(7))-methyltransferase RsmG [Petrocella sp. FN5]
MNINKIIESFKVIGINLSDQQAKQFSIYYSELILWNDKINLTSILEEDAVLSKHFVDSVLSTRVMNYKDVKKLIDVGSGAGFPGIPLKIIYPHIEVVLLDALNKRVAFLNHIIKKLDLSNIYAIHGRAEDLARTELRESFDLCVSRAVSQLNVLCEYCLPFISNKGLFISYKGNKTLEELDQSKNAILILGGVLERVVEDVSLDANTDRGFVMIRKVFETDMRYPRRSGKPLKKPL